MMSPEDWANLGTVEPLTLAGRPLQIFTVRRELTSNAPWITFVHGFPSSSWEWAESIRLLEKDYRILTMDLVGFGHSSKPPGKLSMQEQTDVLQAIWKRFGIQTTFLVAHDFGTCVAQELLARQAEGTPTVKVEKLVLMNGALYRSMHHPLLIQKLLLHRWIGPALSRVVGKKAFHKSLRRISSPQHCPSAETLDRIWDLLHRGGNSGIFHRGLFYMRDRVTFGERWERALETTPVPLWFLWGSADPVSGSHVLEHLRTRLQAPQIVELPRVGHFPQLEQPERVAEELRKIFAQL